MNKLSTDTLMCKTGLHAWSPWQYVSDDGCRQKRACTRVGCDACEYRVEHTWGLYHALEDNTCVKTRECQRCGADAPKFDEDHAYEMRYVAEGSCERVFVCAKCARRDPDLVHNFQGLLTKLLPDHEWGEWRVTGSCTETRKCARCAQQQTRVTHSWCDWQFVEEGGCEQSRTCQNCKQSETRAVHTRSAWSYVAHEQDGFGTHTWFCSRCMHTTTEMIFDDIDKQMQRNRAQLRRQISEAFNIYELERACLDLGLDDGDILISPDKSGKAKNLLEAMISRGRLNELVEYCCHERPGLHERKYFL